MDRRLWTIVLCAGVVLGLSLGFRQCLGLFLAPISADMGGERAGFAFAMGVMNLFWGLASPFTGAVADRYGAGRVVVFGGVCYTVGLLAMRLGGDGEQLVLGGVLIGLGLSGAGFSVVLGTVGRATSSQNRSLALAIASMGGSIGQFALLPFTHFSIAAVGWSAALLMVAATTALVVPLAWGLKGQSQPLESTGQSLGQAFTEACRVKSFWLLNAGFFVCGFHLAFVATHLPAYLADNGFEPWLGVATLTLVGLCNIIGVYGFGILGGHFSKKGLLSWLYLARGAIFLVFVLTPPTETTVLIFGATMGFLWLGTVPLTSGVVATMFGTTYMSMLFGIVFLGHQFGGFLGAWLAGYAFDLFGSYDMMWWLCVVLGVFSAILHWPIDERPVTRLAQA